MSEETHAEHLRKALIGLAASGAHGFEGLLASLLEAWTGQRVRLTKSGYQAGRDIGTTGDAPMLVKMEAKRYDATSLDQRELLGEIEETAQDVTGLDAWALATTAVAGEGLVERLQEAARNRGFEAIVLDWSGHARSDLAVFCAAFPDNVVDHVSKAGKPTRGLRAALDGIAQAPGFDESRTRLAGLLTGATMGYQGAREAAQSWFLEAVAAQNEAHARFGQSLAVGADRLITRRAVWQELDQWWTNWSPDAPVAAVLGEEGAGKTWAVFSWLRQKMMSNDLPLTLVFTSNRFPRPGYTDDLEVVTTPVPGTVLSNALAAVTLIDNKSYWHRRLKGWFGGRLSKDRPQMLLVLDGLNERPKTEWTTFLDQVSRRIEGQDVSVAVLVTSRPGYWKRVVAAAGSRAARIPVEGYDDEELTEALQPYGRTVTDIPVALQDLVRKPRYCDLVARHYPRLEAAGDLTVERLIYEDWRDRYKRRRGNLPFSDEDFQSVLVDAAEKVRHDPGRRFSSAELAAFFPDDRHGRTLEELREGSLFEPLPGPRRGYRVEPRRLTHGLGLLLADDLMAVAENPARDLDEELDHWLEPHSSMDIKEHILRAACFYALPGLEEEEGDVAITPDVVVEALLLRWLDSQNMSDAGEAAVAAFFRKAPDLYLTLAERAWSDRASNRLQDRLMRAYLENAREEYLPALNEAAKRWCSYAVPSFTGQAHRVLDDHAERRRAEFFQSLSAEPDDGPIIEAGPAVVHLKADQRLMGLRNLALVVGSVQPDLRAFWPVVVHWAVTARAMGVDNPHAWAWLLRLSEAPLAARLEAEERVLAAGPACAVEAADLLRKLAVRGRELRVWRPLDPENPRSRFEQAKQDVIRPGATDNFPFDEDAGLEAVGIRIDELWAGQSGPSDVALKDALPILGRSRPQLAVDVYAAVLEQVSQRSAEQCEQVALRVAEWIPVLGLYRDALSVLTHRFPAQQPQADLNDPNVWAAANSFEAELALTPPRERWSLLVSWSHKTLEARAADWFGDEDVPTLPQAYASIATAEGRQAASNLMFAMAQCGAQTLPSHVRDMVLEGLEGADDGARCAALILARQDDDPSLLGPAVAALRTLGHGSHRLAPQLAARFFAARGGSLGRKDIEECLELPELSFVVAARGRNEELRWFASASHAAWQQLRSEPEEALDIPPVETDWRSPLGRILISLHPEDVDDPYRSFEEQMRRLAGERDPERWSEYARVVQSPGHEWLDRPWSREAFKQIVALTPDLVDLWLAPVQPDTPRAASLLRRCDGFYDSLCWALLSHGDDRGPDLWRRLMAVNGTVSKDADSRVPTLLIDLFEAEDTPAVESLRAEVLDDLWTDQRLLRFATAVRLAGRNDWLREQALALMASPQLWGQGKGIALLAFSGAPPEDIEAALDAEHRRDTWLREGREALVTYAEHEAFARHWYRDILTQPERLVWWGRYFVLKACVDVRFWAWRDDVEATVEKEQPIERFRLTFLRRVDDRIRNACNENTRESGKRFLGIPLPEVPMPPFHAQVFRW